MPIIFGLVGLFNLLNGTRDRQPAAPRHVASADATNGAGADSIAFGRLPFQDMRRDIDRFIRLATDGAVSETILAQRNPALHAAIAALWRDDAARARVTGADPDGLNRAFEEAAYRVVRRVLAAARRRGDDAFVVDHARFLITRLRWESRAGVGACAAAGSQVDAESPALRDARMKLLVRAILSGIRPARAGKGEHMFKIPREIYDDAVADSGLPRARFSRAMAADPDPADDCKATIALLETALARPDGSGLKLLRDMFGR